MLKKLSFPVTVSDVVLDAELTAAYKKCLIILNLKRKSFDVVLRLCFIISK